MAIGEYIGNGNPDGSVFGQTSTSKIGFFGLATPVVRSTLSNAAVSTTAVVSTSLAYGFSTSTQGDGLIALVNELRAVLVYYGLVA